MKKIVYFIIFILSILSINNVLAATYNNENIIKKAVLIEDYIKKHKIRIEDFIQKYNIKDTSYLKESINELDESIIALNKIKNSEIPIEQSEKIIQTILKRIKDINDKLKDKLYIEKNNFDNRLKSTRNEYSILWNKISNKINDINIKIAKNIFKNDRVLTLKESNIKKSLIKLNKESKKLKYFWHINFKSEKEIKNSFIRILNNIKRELNLMNTYLK